MEQQPGRRQGGRPPAGDGRPSGARPSRPTEDYVEDDPTMVRPFVKSGGGAGGSGGSGGPGGSGAGNARRGRQGSDGGAQGGRARQQNGRNPQNGRNRQNGAAVPGPRPPRENAPQNNTSRDNAPRQNAPRENAPQQVPGLVSNPMPPPRAVARNARPEQVPYPEPDPAMSDLTTTMPILAVPSDDQYDGYDGYQDGPDRQGRHDRDYDNAPPGEHGHFHDDADFGRHRGGNRPPRALKAAGIVAGLVVVGVAAYSVLGGGGSSAPSAGPAAATSSGAAGGAPSDSATSAVPNAPAPTGTPTGSGSSTSSSPSPSHTTKSASKSSSSSHPSTSGASLTSRPSSAPSTSSAAPPPPPPTTPSSPAPTFTTLGPGSSGPAVTQLQQNLFNLGYWVNVNGTYDSTTQRAVSQFQSVNPGTSQADGRGIYGPATDKAMQQAIG